MKLLMKVLALTLLITEVSRLLEFFNYRPNLGLSNNIVIVSLTSE